MCHVCVHCFIPVVRRLLTAMVTHTHTHTHTHASYLTHLYTYTHTHSLTRTLYCCRYLSKLNAAAKRDGLIGSESGPTLTDGTSGAGGAVTTHKTSSVSVALSCRIAQRTPTFRLCIIARAIMMGKR